MIKSYFFATFADSYDSSDEVDDEEIELTRKLMIHS